MKTIYIASINENKNYYTSLLSCLKSGSFNPLKAENEVNDNDLYFLDLTDSTIEELFSKYHWLKKQSERSSIAHLRILPLMVYSSSKDDPFAKWEEGSDEIYEELFSEEFKPFAYDLDNPSSSNEELEHVLSLYYVR